MLLSLDDPLWPTLDGGYCIPYDASEPLKAMQAGEDVWHELWEELHHQGDVGVASYAAVPQLVHMLGGAESREEDFYALIALIELERHRKHNPPLPEWLAGSYQDAWAQLPAIAARDLQGQLEPVMLESVFAVLALEPIPVDEYIPCWRPSEAGTALIVVAWLATRPPHALSALLMNYQQKTLTTGIGS